MNLSSIINDMPLDVWLAQLRQAKVPDPSFVRQAVLLRLLWQESYLTRQGLVTRVEALLGQGCFGPVPRHMFQRDIAWLRRVLADAGYRLAYSRRSDWPGYYIIGRPRLDERLRQLIAGAVAEVDPQQIAASRQLTPAQRLQQAQSMIRLAEQVAVYRLRQQQPQLNEEEAYYTVRRKG